MSTSRSLLAAALLLSSSLLAFGQDRLPTMPRYDRYERMRREMAASVKQGTLTGIRWSDDGKSVTYNRDSKRYRYDLAKKQETEAKDEPVTTPPPTRGRRGGQRRGPERGRQFDTAFSPDEKLKAVSRDRNVYISDADGKNEVAVTTEGSAAARIKYGIASWVYGEELNVREAMWWSPDGKKLAFYQFDESKVPDFYLALNQVKIQDTLDVEAYPKAGAPNPSVKLEIYDLATKTRTVLGGPGFVPNGKDNEIGHYVYDVRWSPDGKELLFNMTNRKQNQMEFCAMSPESPIYRVIIRETQPDAWTENHPAITYLDEETKGPKRFIWTSERNGWRNLYLYDLSGKLINPITQHTTFEVGPVLKVDAKKGLVWYMARDGDNPFKMQLHRVGLDGKGDVRLTDPKFHHTVELGADGSFLDSASAVDVPATTTLRDAKGKEIAVLATPDLSKFDQLGLKKAERFTYLAADGKTVCYGLLEKPSDFDPSKKYPLIVGVYAGPESGGGTENFVIPQAMTELGFLVASFEGRGTQGRGKAFKDALYGKLGFVEIDDQAAGVKALRERPYVDGSRVGIQGTSYGGYSSMMALLRYPDVFQAACSSSPVTSWYNYDSTYTERYEGLPWEGENKEGYEQSQAVNFAKDLKGRLMIYYGTADNNVHPNNSLQVIQALQRVGKSFQVMVGPDQGHSGINFNMMLEFFMDNLVLAPGRKDTLQVAWNKRTYRRRAARDKVEGSS